MLVPAIRSQTRADTINALADRVNRLTVSRHDPEAFYAERSDISAGWRAVARQSDDRYRLRP
jgi:predicted Zn-dependent peptidase